ncbi:MAG: response regulator transcription factor [Nocardioides sp.]|nr:response regulator transcription factor [Nocardioides sp.]
MNDYEVVVAGVVAMLDEYLDRVTVVELDAHTPELADVDVVFYDTFGRAHDDGVQLADLVRSRAAKIVVYTWNPRPDVADRAIALGARGCLSKSLSAEELVEAVEAVHAGVVVTSPEFNEGFGGGEWPGRAAGLTQREAEILALITQGFTNADIAESLFLSINSIKTHIRLAYQRIGVERRTQAVAWCLQNGFAPGPPNGIESSVYS